MDAETLFISCLLDSNKAVQDDFWSKQLPLGIYQLRTKEMAWIYRYRTSHGTFPSKRRFAIKFDDVDVSEHCDEPLNVALEPVLTQATFNQLQGIIKHTSEMFSTKEDASAILAYFKEASAKIADFSVETVDEDLEDPAVAFRRYQQSLKDVQFMGSLVDTPWPRINKLLTYSRPGEMIGIAARLGLGKTWLVLTWANYLASKQIPVLVISKEMPTSQISDRVTALRYGFDWVKFRSSTMEIDEQLRWKKCVMHAEYNPYPMKVSGEETLAGIGIEQVYSKIMRYKPRFVVIDGAYLMNASGLSKNASETDKYSALSRACKRIAKVTQTTLVVVLQQNRTAEGKDGVAKGSVASVYGSDAWAQDSDVLMEIGGERGADERVVMIHKSRESNIGDIFINFKLSPRPNFTEKASLSASSKMGSVKFKVLK